ncbi:PASTA domain-containing penicillin-binding protein [Alkalihalobacillus sp. AL-G]|uniref:PASTA domain-containing penicillin-binding protein n=1 Tax=Alkalihalobacillus sp. AL-G TaxID=2926399 RepID=UPI002729B084|nr:PASTA domain-containing penicillin-binding protein [Alkalihalobacillus sp. AL-G]WLD95061.1 PASTA domain-containing protein [Alkalihalobacillus sp. AL-G]
MNGKKNPNINKGAVILSLIFVLLFFVLTGRYFYLGWTGEAEGKDLEELAKQKWTIQQPLDADRGSFFDRKGEVIAEDIPAYTVVAILAEDYENRVSDPEKTAEKLAPLLDMSESRLIELMSKEERWQVELGPGGDKISHSKMNKIKELGLDGIVFKRKTKRYYPNQKFASHIIGFTAIKEGERVGAMGLEQTLDEHLHEEDGRLIYQQDFEGYKLPDPKEVMVEPKNGYNVHLTIDENIQLFLEQAMTEVNEEYDPKRMIGIVADPNTGKILAMSNRPSFNPNIRDIENYSNFAISSRFEPGSTMKIFTLAAAIEEGAYNGNATYKSGTYTTSFGEKIGDHSGIDGEIMTYDEGFIRSSNVAFMKIAAEQLGFENLNQYLTERFEFDQPTGVDLPGEADSKIQFKWETEKLTTAFGQGTAITPIQQIQAATAIANGGKMMKPYVIEKIVNPDNEKVVQNHEPEVVGTPISKETSEHVRNLMRSVVTDGTGERYYNIEGYEVAGKTGTAEIPDPKGGYLEGYDNYVFSFLGMAPKDDPKLLIYIAIDRPNLDVESYESGSVPVSKVFNFVMKNSLQYLNIAPVEGSSEHNGESKKDVTDNIPLNDYEGGSSIALEQELKEKGLDVHVLGEGDEVIAQTPFAGTAVLKGQKIILRTSGTVKMPDLTGWSRAEVLQLARILNLKTPEFIGNGYVVLQSIPPKAKVKEGSHLVIELKAPQQIAEEKKAKEKEKGNKEHKEEPVTD